MKLLGNGLVSLSCVLLVELVPVEASVWQSGLASPRGRESGLGPTPVSRVATGGNAPASLPSFQGLAPWKSIPLPRTVTPAPSNAPIREGSCNCSARLPFCVASQPTVASRGIRSTCGELPAVTVPPANPAWLAVAEAPLPPP